jgi:hypothetical protein
MSQLVKLKDLPLLAKALSPFSRKRSAIICEADSVTCSGTYWDGGSISRYVHLSRGGYIKHISAPSAPPQFGGAEAPHVEIRQGHIIVKLGTTAGKPSYPVVFIREEDLEAWGLAD